MSEYYSLFPYFLEELSIPTQFLNFNFLNILVCLLFIRKYIILIMIVLVNNNSYMANSCVIANLKNISESLIIWQLFVTLLKKLKAAK